MTQSELTWQKLVEREEELRAERKLKHPGPTGVKTKAAPLEQIALQKHIDRLCERDPIKGCLLHGKGKRGYGGFKFGKLHGTHRVMYIAFHGTMIEDQCVCHECDVPRCVEPTHLFQGTQRRNLEDMTEKGRRRWAEGENSGSSKLTKLQVREIRDRYRPGMHSGWNGCTAIGKDYGVSTNSVRQIISGAHWKNA